MDYVFRVAGEWSVDLLIADREDLENLFTSEVLVERFNHQEVWREETLLFPCASGILKLFDLPRSRLSESSDGRTSC